MNCSDEEVHCIVAAKVIDMVMEAQTKKNAAPNDGIPSTALSTTQTGSAARATSSRTWLPT